MLEVPRTPFEISVDRPSGRQYSMVRVTGEIDLTTSPNLADGLARASAICRPVVVDLRECSFVDATGIRTLLTASRRTGPVRVVAAGPVRRTLNVCGVGDAIGLCGALPAGGPA
jgi:anti-anti-sigma factor